MYFVVLTLMLLY